MLSRRDVAVLCACIALDMSSGPGHTFGVNEFVEDIIQDLGITRTRVSLVWFCASLSSAVCVSFAGWFVDKYPPILILSFLTPVYVTTVFCMGETRSTWQLIVALSLMRFLGPECMCLISRTTLNRTFVSTRGKVSAIHSIPVTAFLLCEPVILSLIIRWIGWRSTYHVVAFAICAALAVGTYLLLRGEKSDRSESIVSAQVEMMRVSPFTADRQSYTPVKVSDEDRKRVDSQLSKSFDRLDGMTFREALSTSVFWAIVFASVPGSLFWSGMNYHISDHVRKKADLDPEIAAAAVFLPLTLVSILTNVGLSAGLVDRFGPRAHVRMYAGSCVSILLAMTLALDMRSKAVVAMYGACLGIFEGSSLAMYNVIFASLFGRRALGRIRGIATGFPIFATGIGPVFFSLISDTTPGGSYDPAIYILGLAALFMSTLLFVVPVASH